MRKKAMNYVSKVTELSKKVELSYKDDAGKLARNQNGFENDFLKERKAVNNSIKSFDQAVSFLKKDINSAKNLWNRIEKDAIKNEIIANKLLNKINISAKELGVDPSKVDGYKELSEINSRVNQLKRLMDINRAILKEYE
tara:strand:+ start:32 stop:451 length:420 start_codon:yes stop_codon:yes gene_type:complete